MVGIKMKYTKALLNTKLDYNKLSRGKLRMLGRLVSMPVGLAWDSFKYSVMLPTTIAVDTPRFLKYKHIKRYYFKRNWKPYVLQRWIDYESKIIKES